MKMQRRDILLGMSAKCVFSFSVVLIKNDVFLPLIFTAQKPSVKLWFSITDRIELKCSLDMRVVCMFICKNGQPKLLVRGFGHNTFKVIWYLRPEFNIFQ